jgi:integrase
MASFLKTKTGTFRVQIEHNGKREYKTFRTKSLATIWANQREAELERGLIASVDLAQRTALDEVIEDYRIRVLPTKRGHHLKSSLGHLQRRFGHMRLISITPRDVSLFRDERLKAGASGSTVTKDLNLLRVLIDHAILELSIHLPSNPARLCKNPKCSAPRTRVLEPEEEELLLEVMKHPLLPSIVKLAIETAMRLGELLNMRRSVCLALFLCLEEQSPSCNLCLAKLAAESACFTAGSKPTPSKRHLAGRLRRRGWRTLNFTT